MNSIKSISTLLITLLIWSINYELNAQKNNVRYLHTVFDHIEIEKDLIYGEAVNFQGEKQSLALDIYTPKNDHIKNRPVIVWLHGGGFRYGNDKSQSYIVEMASRFAKKGYVCLSLDYRVRKSPKTDMAGTLSDAIEDANKGLNWLRANGDSLNVDISKIIIGGGSAGGILGSPLVFNNTNKEENTRGIIGFINLWGTPDEKWSKLDVDKNDPPTIIVHGSEDQSVSYDNSVLLIDSLKANNIKNELVTYKGAGHTPVKYMDEFEVKIAKFLYDIIN
ncbi:alpha/beta hydrolase [Aurantibacter sp.]|uniref:alpha/beta hydrolase n=1 Tax=Aurantibacter sp. TaxID=2807103 RepID=UPI003264CEBD